MKNPLINRIVQKINTEAFDNQGRMDGNKVYELIEEGIKPVIENAVILATTDQDEQTPEQEQRRSVGRPKGSTKD